MARRARKSKSSTVKVNFKGVESRRTPAEGDYIVEVIEAKSGESSSGNDQIEFVLEIVKGEFKGAKLWFYCPLAENSLWKLHAFLTALGEEVPEDEMDIDLSDLVGKQCVGVLSHETYNGKKRAKMTDFDSLENYSGGDADDDEDEDEKPKKGKKGAAGKKSKKDEDEDEDDEEEEAPKKGKKSKGKSKSDDDDEDEDDKPQSKRGKGKASKKKKTYDRDEVEDMDEDELEEVIEEAGLDVDLDDYKKLPKKVAAVIEALEEEDLLDD